MNTTYLTPAGEARITWTRVNPNGRPVGAVDKVPAYRDRRLHDALVMRHGDGVAPLNQVARFARVEVTR